MSQSCSRVTSLLRLRKNEFEIWHRIQVDMSRDTSSPTLDQFLAALKFRDWVGGAPLGRPDIRRRKIRPLWALRT
jgi:hypothetical protein